ncbi:hypothetical protein N431DRAFT_19683 [Stipitochalara longipes BDJ]|nr:hypothetical protein N431DRAFT_19683 [Stipitochalara longipes BDJ]
MLEDIPAWIHLLHFLVVAEAQPQDMGAVQRRCRNRSEETNQHFGSSSLKISWLSKDAGSSMSCNKFASLHFVVPRILEIVGRIAGIQPHRKQVKVHRIDLIYTAVRSSGASSKHPNVRGHVLVGQASGRKFVRGLSCSYHGPRPWSRLGHGSV